jgi:hypothetical protein
MGDQIKKEWDGRGMWHVWGKRRGAYRVLMGRPVGRNNLELLGIDGSIVLTWIFKEWDGQ